MSIILFALTALRQPSIEPTTQSTAEAASELDQICFPFIGCFNI